MTKGKKARKENIYLWSNIPLKNERRKERRKLKRKKDICREIFIRRKKERNYKTIEKHSREKKKTKKKM